MNLILPFIPKFGIPEIHNVMSILKLSRALGGSPQFWFNLQNNWELSQLDVTVFKDIQPTALEVH
jgi:plasmid maintenance system antidote protein VapI